MLMGKSRKEMPSPAWDSQILLQAGRFLQMEPYLPLTEKWAPPKQERNMVQSYRIKGLMERRNCPGGLTCSE